MDLAIQKFVTCEKDSLREFNEKFSTSSLTINNLPPEIIEIILGYLDLRSMISSTLVSRLWNKIISTSKIFLSKVIYVLKTDGNFNPKFKRRYQRIRIAASYPCYNKVNQQDKVILFLNQLSSDVKTLMIHGIDLGDTQYRLDLKFKWKELELFGIKSMYAGNWSNLVTTADKGSSVYIGYECYESFLKSFLNEVHYHGMTDNLKIQLHALNNLDLHFYDGLVDLTRIQSLEIKDDLLHMRRPCVEIDNRVASLSLRLPNIVKLKLDYRSTFYFQISYGYNFSNVIYLKVEKITEHLPQLIFPELKYLEIENCKTDDIIHLQYLCKRLCKLKAIKVHVKSEFNRQGKEKIFTELFNILPESTKQFQIVDIRGNSIERMKN